jgi:GAF domain-containing protein
MTKPPIPRDEEARLEALRQYQILDTASEQVFDRITELAADVCGTPVSALTFVDEDRQWFKANVGLSVTETSRDVAFCAHAILQEDLFTVPDALADDRFAQNPLVTHDPKIRFYAGMPLITQDGHALGTLCVMDWKPRQLSAEQRGELRALAKSVLSILESRRQNAEAGRPARPDGSH